ncbi:hypothetical protein [Alkalihalobacillus trypoxylicola]|uniref:Phosphoglyceromutase n=1 Tax=Alkalihalobacillus trypoxylicola TaxID=519424 RepID=A0A161Q7S3_9BACI|nr:hypothetical protein [Alkalihalobacillus trypoxylicola]KYG33002.1 hypothetical protein AZF04_17740 [Alkalihalobacillus trypoxylicola]
MFTKILKVLSLIVFLVLCYSQLAVAEENIDSSTKEHMKIVIAPGLSFDDAKWLVEHGRYDVLWEESALGAMNVRPDGAYQYLPNLLSISTGTKSRGIPQWNAYEKEEIIDDVNSVDYMHQLTGLSSESPIVHPFLHKLKEENTNNYHDAQIGSLGESLKNAGVKRLVLGNSDVGEERVRFASLLTIDKQGQTLGELKETVRSNPRVPYGIEMDSDYLLNQINTFVGQHSSTFVAVEWGDLYRLDRLKGEMEPVFYQSIKEEALFHLESFINELVLNGEDEPVWLISPIMNQDSLKNKQQLAPIFTFDQDGGSLTSLTTRQSYLVANVDVVPTILNGFGLQKTDEYIGHPIIVEKSGDVNKQPLFEEVDEIVHIYKTRASVLSIYISCLAILLLSSGLMIFFLRENNFGIKILKVTLLTALSSPLFFLLLAPINTLLNQISFLMVMLLCSLLTGYLCYRFIHSPVSFITSCLFIAITIDLTLGESLIQRSYLGYDPIIGARYYGIGNEYAGIYISSALTMLVPFFHKRNWKVFIVASILLVQMVILASQSLGTNAGATLSAAIAYTVAILLLLGFKTKTSTLWIIGTFGLFTGLILLYGLQLIGVKSHIGLAFERLTSGDLLYIKNIIFRKLEMNYKLFRHSNWTQLFVSSYLVVLLLIWTKRNRMMEFSKRLYLQIGVIASVALLLLNDSGVVAAATSMFCIVITYCYWILTAHETQFSPTITKKEKSTQQAH